MTHRRAWLALLIFPLLIAAGCGEEAAATPAAAGAPTPARPSRAPR